jgi:DNA-directed RNA polymerase subunit beta
MHVVRSNRLEEVSDDDPDVDFELTSPARQFGPHINAIPLGSAVQSPRLFYGARFLNQALAIENGEAPLVQSLNPEDEQGRSFDEIIGEQMGILRASKPGRVVKVSDDAIQVRYDDGEKAELDLYNNVPFNQKSGISSRPLIRPGDSFTPGQLLSASSYTDDTGTLNMGLNARIALVPWKGFSMDDALPISESFARRLKATQFKVVRQAESDGLKSGLNHYRALFPGRFSKEQLEHIDENGVVKSGTTLQPGDPIVISTAPRKVSSVGANLGRLSRATRQQRRDASQVWDGSQPATVVAARMTKNGPKVVLKYAKPTEPGDKLVLRQGAKSTVSVIIPDDQMPRTEDGQPLDALLNPLSLVSRANLATLYEMRLGKVAKKLGQPLKVPSYLPNGEEWESYISKLEAEAGVEPEERVFDPTTGRFIEGPVTVGYGFLNKLHHVAEGKASARGTGSYDQNQQPARGAGDMAQAKRFSGLENFAALSAGAYAVLRENSTLRGQANDEYWRAMSSGRSLPKPDVPFVWHKFKSILAGAGMNAKEVDKGILRLSPFRDADLDEHDPIDVDRGDLVDLRTLDPIPGGLFDPRIVTGERWGRIRLPRPVINPAMEDSVRVLLGLTKQELQDVLAGKKSLSEARKKS